MAEDENVLDGFDATLAKPLQIWSLPSNFSFSKHKDLACFYTNTIEYWIPCQWGLTVQTACSFILGAFTLASTAGSKALFPFLIYRITVYCIIAAQLR